MKLTSTQIQNIQNFFAIQPDILVVYLYGSFADNRTHPNSDLDLAVLFKTVPKNHYRLGEVTRDLSKLDLPTYNLDVREIKLGQAPLYLKNVIKGQLIFSQDEPKRVKFEVEVMNRFYDTERLRNLKSYYTRKRLQEGSYGY